MKKNALLSILFLLFITTGCTVDNPEEATPKIEISDFQESQNQIIDDKDIDVDLTKLSATMIYGEVYNMINDPKKYEGKTIKISGSYSEFQDETTLFHHVIIEDATECCQQGLEIKLKEGFTYPEVNTKISIVGEFEIYSENEEYQIYQYRLKNAVYSE